MHKKLTIFLLAVCVLITGSIFLNQLYNHEQETKPPLTVSKFLELMINYADDYATRSELVTLFLRTEDSLSDTFSRFDYVVANRDDERVAASIKFDMSQKGYTEFTMYDKDGSPIYPRVGFLYNLSPDGLYITDWEIGRLEPFDRLDPEYSAKWW